MKRYSITILTLLALAIVTASALRVTCLNGFVVSPNKPLMEQFDKKGCVYIINSDINLSGDAMQIPDDCTLKFNGGRIRNGVVCGCRTKIDSKGIIFDNVKIEGSWLVPEISTGMFGELSEDNALRNVVALSDSSIKNIIHIEEGKYWVKATDKEISGLQLRSNSEVIIDGKIQLRPNNLIRSYVLLIQNCHDVIVRGKGSIIGEKDQHLGKEGEWGMGIYIKNASNITIDDISVSNCWGDCITLATNCYDVKIENCKLSNARRQGISITGRKNIEVRKCVISDIHGTNPEYGIDIEPDANGETRDITISDCVVLNSGGGYLAYGGASNVEVSNIVLKNCRVNGLIGKKPSIWLQKVKDCKVERCKVENVNTNCLRADYSYNITITNNNFNSGTVDCTIRCIESSGIIIDNNELTAPRTAINNLSNAAISNNKIHCRYLTEKDTSKLSNVVISNNIIR